MTMTADSALQTVTAAAPRINALQKLWLREIGIEKTWIQEAERLPLPVSTVPVRTEQEPALNAPLPSDIVPARINVRDGVPTPEPKRAPSPPIRAKQEPVIEVPVAAPSLSGAVSKANFDELCELVQACTACGLHQGRRHAVFGMGARPARWMIIGEAPGEQEDRQGLPFVGRSGQLLDAMLSAVGMTREQDVFIANVIKCRPPGNRNPKVDEIAACGSYLTRQIELIQPERILVLGRFAAQTLLKTDATIGHLRGKQHEWITAEGRRIPVIVSYHPAYLLRSPVEKARAWQDLQLALATTAEAQ
jgi:uracil-DNA glycosylase family 4